MILVLYTQFEEIRDTVILAELMACLPEKQRERIIRCIRWQDRHARLFARLLLDAGLRRFGYSGDVLRRLQTDEKGRPYIDSSIDFNISHSGETVVCALTDRGRVGIDIEKMQNIPLSDFRSYMTDAEWEAIIQASNVSQAFYNFWTIKESVLKAEGSGLSISLSNVRINCRHADLNERQWRVIPLAIHEQCRCHLATDLEKPEIRLERINPICFYPKKSYHLAFPSNGDSGSYFFNPSGYRLQIIT